MGNVHVLHVVQNEIGLRHTDCGIQLSGFAFRQGEVATQAGEIQYLRLVGSPPN